MRPIALLMILSLLTVPTPARAARLTGVPTRVRPGSRLTIRWGELSPAVDEVEVELSLDGGPWRRISAALDPAARRLEWCLPSRGGHAARLRLRAGGPMTERVVAESRAFWIEPDSPRPNALDDDAWWWLHAGAAASPAMRADERLSVGAAGGTLVEAAAAPSAPARPAGEAVTDVPATTRIRVTRSAAVASPGRAFHPLRN